MMAGPGQLHQSLNSVQGVDNDALASEDEQQAMAYGLIGTFEDMPLAASGFPTQVPSNQAACFLSGSLIMARAQSSFEDSSLKTPSALPYDRDVLLQGRPPQGTQYYYHSPMALFPEPRPANSGLQQQINPDLPQTPTKVPRNTSVPHTPSDQNSSPGLLLSSPELSLSNPSYYQSPDLLLDSLTFPHDGLFKDQLHLSPPETAQCYPDNPQPSQIWDQIWSQPTDWETQQARYQHNLRMAQFSALLDLPVDDPFAWAPPGGLTLPPSPSDPETYYLTPPESPSEPWFSAQQPSTRTARTLFIEGMPSSGLQPAQTDLLEKFLATTASFIEDKQKKTYHGLINKSGGKVEMNPMAPPFESLQVYLGQIPPSPGSDLPDQADNQADNIDSNPRTPSPKADKKKDKGKRKRLASSPENGSDKGKDADRHVYKGKGRDRAASAASVEELPRTPSHRSSGKKRAISISSGDEPLPSTRRLDKGKGRALPPFHPDSDESFAEHVKRAGPLEFLDPGVVAGIINSSPQKGSYFCDELFAIGGVGSSRSVPEYQTQDQPPDQSSPQAVRYFVGRPSAGEASGYNTATTCSRDLSPAFNGGSAPSAGYASGGYTTVYICDTTMASNSPVSRSVPTTSSGTGTIAAPSVQGTSSVEPLSTGLGLFAPPGKGPYYEPPSSRPPLPTMLGLGSSPGLGFGSSASPFVIYDAPSRCASPSQQAGPPNESNASLRPLGHDSDSQLGASSSTPIVIDDGISQTESIIPIDLDTPSPPPDATASYAAGNPSALVVNGSISRDETGSGSPSTSAALSDLTMHHNEVPTDPLPAAEPLRTPLKISIERQQSRALHAKPKYSSPLRFSAATPSADEEYPGPPDDDN